MNFYKMFLESFGEFFECLGGTKFKLVNAIIERSDKNNMVFVTSEELAKDINVSHSSVSKYMIVLLRHGFIKKKRAGVYQINPEMIFKGQHRQRMEAVAKYTLAN